MTARASARSISRPVREQLRRSPSSALHVLAVFERACDLVACGGPNHRPVMALVTPEIGNGPLNIVVDGSGWNLTSIRPGARAQTDGERLQVGGLEIDVSSAAVWEPQPDWPSLRMHQGAIEMRLTALRDFCLAYARAGSLLALLHEGSGGHSPRRAVLAAARSGLDALAVGWAGDMARLREGAAQLAGLGGGLTPGGDDFLCGAMLWAWLAHSTPISFCRTIVESAAPRTTTLSAAFLWAAAQGECHVAWHVLLEALARGDDVGVARAAEDVLAHGATSGADALAGFVWAGMRIGQQRPMRNVIALFTIHHSPFPPRPYRSSRPRAADH